MGKTSLGIDENLESTLCYLLGWMSGLFFFFVEHENKIVRFHALQSLFVFLFLNLLMGVAMLIPFVGWFFLLPQLFLGYIVLWIFLVVNAYQGRKIYLPFFGGLAEKYSSNRTNIPQ